VRECVLVAGGGGGPTHGGFIAEILGIPTVIVPSVAALFSAFGMFAMDLGEDYLRSFVARCATVDLDEINRLFEEMEQEARASFRAIGVSDKKLALKRTADMRFVGQFHEVETEVPAGKLKRSHIDATVKAFMRKHEALFTFAMPWQPVEILYLRLKAVAPRAPFRLREIGKGTSNPALALKRRRKCRFDGKDVDTPVYDGEKIRAGNLLTGPAIVEESTMTVVVPKGFRCRVDAYKNYVLTRQVR
jgi:N-methylhydantoinase A